MIKKTLVFFFFILYTQFLVAGNSFSLALVTLKKTKKKNQDPQLFFKKRVRLFETVLKSLENEDVDLVVFPEFSLIPSRFLYTKRMIRPFSISLSPSNKDPYYEDLKSLAIKYKTAISYNISEKTPGLSLYNTSFLIDQNGQRAKTYRKINPFLRSIFKPGEKVQAPLFANLKGQFISYMVCFDVLFSFPTKLLNQFPSKRSSKKIILSPVSSSWIRTPFETAHTYWSGRNEGLYLAVSDNTANLWKGITHLYLNGNRKREENLIQTDLFLVSLYQL